MHSRSARRRQLRLAAPPAAPGAERTSAGGAPSAQTPTPSLGQSRSSRPSPVPSFRSMSSCFSYNQKEGETAELRPSFFEQLRVTTATVAIEVPLAAGAAVAGGVASPRPALCSTPIASPETTSCTRRFCARPATVPLSATGLPCHSPSRNIVRLNPLRHQEVPHRSGPILRELLVELSPPTLSV